MAEVSKKRKILVILEKIVFIGLIAALAVVFVQERNKRIEVEKLLESTRQAGEQLERNLDKIRSEKAVLEGELKDSKAQAEALAAILAEEKRVKKSLSAQVKELKSNLAMIKGDEELLAELRMVKKEKDSLQLMLEQLRLAKKALEEKITSGENGGVVKLPEVVVSPAAEKEKPKVLVVNREFDFVVVNLGKRNGISVGDLLTVYRKRKYIGKVKVEEVHNSISAAVILPEWSKRKVRENDHVMPE